MLDDAAARNIVREELARHRAHESFTAVVSATDPLTVRLNSGADVHITHRVPGLELTQGDFVAVRYTGEGYQLASKLLAPDVPGELDFPDHTHDGSYSPLSHVHLGWQYLTTLVGTGASNTISYSLPFGYKHFRFWIRWSHTGTGSINAFVRLNNDSGANYNLIRYDNEGGVDTHDLAESADRFFHRVGSAVRDGTAVLQNVAASNVGWQAHTGGRGAGATNTQMVQNSTYENGPATSIQFLTGNAAGTGGGESWTGNTDIDVEGFKVV